MTAITRRIANRLLSPMQWLMFIAMLAIGCMMLLPSTAHAAPIRMVNYLGPIPQAQTISHCGWLNARSKTYSSRPMRIRRIGVVPSRNTVIVQSKLETIGYSVGHPGIDGIHGPLTRQAVRHFQRDHNIKQTGSVGRQTAQALAYASAPMANIRKCKHPARLEIF